MVRVLSVLALVLSVVVPGQAQVPAHKHKHHPAAVTPAAVQPVEKGPDVPNGPLDVPRWMGSAVDNILTGGPK